MSSPKRLIVNADDFGRTPGINRGIVEAHDKGIVTSASAMVACPAVAEAAQLAAGSPRLGVGLHVTLSGGRALLPPTQVPSLVDASGRLPPKPEGLVGADPQDVLAEARAQLRRFREVFGRPPTHLDSHHHSQKVPAVLDALVTLSWETGLPVRSVTAEMRALFGRERIPTPDRFEGSFYDQGATREGLLRILAGLSLGTTELMCHPAVVDDELRSSSSYAEPRARELAVLSDPEARLAVQASGIRLIHFGELVERGS